MNFDLENVPEFAAVMNESFGPGLRADVLVDFTKSVAVGEEETLVLRADLQGNKEPLEMVVHMDDIDAPDIYFFSPSEELITAINAAMIDFAESKGI